jgi:Mg2+/Co2+ transporter CorC
MSPSLSYSDGSVAVLAPEMSDLAHLYVFDLIQFHHTVVVDETGGVDVAGVVRPEAVTGVVLHAHGFDNCRS